jgi:hypothetical protein
MENSLLWATTAPLAQRYRVHLVTKTGREVHKGKHRFRISQPAMGSAISKA